MALSKLRPEDPRVERRDATVRGRKYHYLHGKPQGAHKATILLCHGFPDLSFGWRAQIPMLIDLGLQVIAPDLLGYGRTDAPKELAPYSHKSISDDLAELVAQIAPGEQIVLGGHDWGGVLVWRFANWHPELVKAIVCLTPYSSPHKDYYPLELVVKMLPNFTYQLQFAGPEPGRHITTPQKMRGFLNAIMGGKGPNGEVGLTITEGAVFENLDIIERSPLLNEEEAAFYTSEYMRNGIDAPLNWYRTRQLNHGEELALFDAEGKAPRIKAPTCFIAAGNDVAIPVSMSDGMEVHFDDIEKHVVPGTHWVLFQSAEEVNKHIKEFLIKQLDLNVTKASI